MEIAYAFDTLSADGIALFTSYGDKWLGNPEFRPVMEELNRRRAVVTVHPTAADCCRNLAYAPGVGPGSIEYGTDTTRAIMGVAFSGDAVRFPAIRFIWSHAGGTVPFLASRIEGAASGARDALPRGFAAELKKFHYDVAGAANRGALASLVQLVPSSQIVFGTDFPPGGTSAAVAKALTDVGLFSEIDLRAIDRENAVRLLPRLAE
jgi:predicted TIM-barrel fold metal-dependent hydrolase